jgi:hypothetical protein
MNAETFPLGDPVNKLQACRSREGL